MMLQTLIKALLVTTVTALSLTGCAPEEQIEEELPANTFAPEGYNFTLEYPEGWEVWDKEDEGMGIIITAHDEDTVWGGTNLNLNLIWEVGGVGLGWTDAGEEELVNQHGVKFTLHYHKIDPEFNPEWNDQDYNPNKVIITIGTDAIPGLKIFNYDELVNPNGEAQLKEILETVQVN